MARILFAGYLGAGNLGDDAVLLGFVEGLRQTQGAFNLSMLSGAPEETYRNYGIASRPRRDSRAVKEAIAACDMLVMPGGSIFQDATSVGSVLYYAGLVSQAKKAGKKVFLVGQGVGPLKTFIGKRAAAKAFSQADGITVRDPASAQTLKDLGVKTPVRLAADSAFLLPEPATQDEQSFQVGDMKSVAVSVRPVKGVDVVGVFGDFCRGLYGKGMIPTLVEMDRNEDGPLIQEIAKRHGGSMPNIRKIDTPMRMQSRLQRMDCLVGLRLHAGILAATVGVPSLLVSYDPKVAAFSKAMDAPGISPEGLTGARLLDSFLSFQQDRERQVRQVAAKRAEMQQAAMASVELVVGAIRR